MKNFIRYFKSTFDRRDYFRKKLFWEFSDFFKLQLCTDELTLFVFSFPKLFNKLIISWFYYFQHLFFFNILQFLHPAGSGRTPLLSRQGDPTHFPFLKSLQLLQELWTATPLHVSGSPGFPEHLFFFISLQSRQPFRNGSVRPFFRVVNLLSWPAW